MPRRLEFRTKGGRVCLDMTKVEAVMVEDCKVLVITPNEVYQVDAEYPEVVERWKTAIGE